MPLTVGTAGHIDHGKTWLVRALTGKDTDRLPEEQARGISIDLGYAPLELPDGRRLSLVDVPGHERFVRAMVAGASGIDLFLLVIDAREGARPQTHEHLAVLRLLGVERGVVAITKIDATDAETVELAVLEARELVPGAEVVPVSAKTGEGLDELRAALARVPIDERDSSSPTRLWVDRAFSLAGAGTIATGTLWSGRIAPGDLLRVEPRGRTARVRTVHVHDAQVDEAAAGQRVAVNLPTLRRGDVARGDVLVEPNAFPVSYRLDVRLEELERVPPAVTVHIGTKATPARVARAGPYAQLRLSEPVVAARGDRVILRTDTTVAGGVVLDPVPPRRLERDRLETLERGDPIEIVRTLVHAPITGRELEARGLLTPRELAHGLATMQSAGDYYFSPEWLDGLRAGVRNRLVEHAAAHPLDPGVPWRSCCRPNRGRPTCSTCSTSNVATRRPTFPGPRRRSVAVRAAATALEAELAADEVVRVEDRELAAFLEQEGRLRRVGDGLAVSTALYDRGRDLLPGLGEITLPGFRDALGVGRRTAQLLLERYDADGLTRRRGDVRVLRRSRNQ